MRDRTHGKESKTQKEVYEARIDAKNNMGTYKASIAMNESDKETTNKQQDHTQQLSNVSTNKQKTNQYCPWCKAETDHKTWPSVRCSAHNEYVKEKPSQTANKTKEKKNPTYQDDGQKKKEEVSEVSLDVVGGGGGAAIGGAVLHNSHCKEQNIVFDDYDFLYLPKEHIS